MQRSLGRLVAAAGLVALLAGCDGVMNLPTGPGGVGGGLGGGGLTITRANIDPSTVRVAKGQALTLSVETSNPGGGSLYYSWTASGGTLSSTNTNPVRWTAPASAGRVRIVVYVQNGREVAQAEYGLTVE